MDFASITLVSSGLLAFALISGRLQGTIITPPLVFIVFGYLIGPGVFGVARVQPGHGVIYGRHAAGMRECEENMPVSEMPLRKALIVQR
ncbi:MAG: hypothetical protein E4H01_01820 [Lysobacterales bacterium]|nr:MAG: hypothetical protein E4H01_01820 [Xanthomonadales bacterium]